MEHSTKTLKAQLAIYQSNGWRAIPLDPPVRGSNGKTPPRGFPLATYLHDDNPPPIPDQWLETSNVGIVTGRVSSIAVLDLDNADAIDQAKRFGLPETPMAASGRGMHVYFQYDPALRTGVGLLPGLDLKSDGGYVVAPPSVHASGKQYRWIVPPETPLAPAPSWLFALVAFAQTHKSPSSQSQPTQTRSSSNSSSGMATDGSLSAQIAAALGVERYNAAGWSNAVHCPFHDDQRASATWHRDGQLKCHAGCTPGPNHVSAGRSTFGLIDTARQLGIALPASEESGQDYDYAVRSGETTNANAAGDLFCFCTASTLSTSGGVQKSNTRHHRHPHHLIPLLPGASYTIPSPSALNARYTTKPHYRQPTAHELSNAKSYRASVYAYIPETSPGVYSRSHLAALAGVSKRTTHAYDRLADVEVIPQHTRIEIGPEAALHLPDQRKDAPPNVWLEDSAGRKYPPTKSGLERALQANYRTIGIATCERVERTPNYYRGTRARREATNELCIEARRALIVAGMTTAARVLDVLYRSGVRGPFTAAQAVRVAAAFGLSRSTVYAALRQLVAEEIVSVSLEPVNAPAAAQPAAQPVPAAGNSAPSGEPEPPGEATMPVVHYCTVCGQQIVTPFGLPEPPDTCAFCGDLTTRLHSPPRACSPVPSGNSAQGAAAR